MNFHVKHRGFEYPPELQGEIEGKLHRFDRLLPENAYVELTLKQLPKVQRNGNKEAEIMVDIPGVTPVVRFVCQGQTWIEAVDCAFDKLDEDLTRQNSKRKDHHYDGPPPKEWLAEVVNKEEME